MEKMTFSIDDKEILIKAIAFVIPTHTMEVFQLRHSLYLDIQAMVARFWWGGNDDGTKLHWQCQEKLCKTKKNRGMGFRDFEAFNIVMIGKQGWHLI